MSYLAFGAGDISPHRFTLGWAFHRPPKPPFSWFVRVTVWARAIARASCQGLNNIYFYLFHLLCMSQIKCHICHKT